MCSVSSQRQTNTLAGAPRTSYWQLETLPRVALPFFSQVLSPSQLGSPLAKLDMEEFLERFKRRAQAVKDRGVPPLEGAARKQFIEAAEMDFVDYSLVASASWSVDDGELVLRIPISG